MAADESIRQGVNDIVIENRPAFIGLGQGEPVWVRLAIGEGTLGERLGMRRHSLDILGDSRCVRLSSRLSWPFP